MSGLCFNKKNNVVIALTFLLFGSLIYIVFRSTTLMMFRWADTLGITTPIDALRLPMQNHIDYIPDWLVYSIPFALWVVAYMLFVNVIWWDSKSHWRHFWFWLVPIIAILAEFCQWLRFIPGTFDTIDLFVLVLGTAIPLCLCSLSNNNLIRRSYEQ